MIARRSASKPGSWKSEPCCERLVANTELIQARYDEISTGKSCGV